MAKPVSEQHETDRPSKPTHSVPDREAGGRHADRSGHGVQERPNDGYEASDHDSPRQAELLEDGSRLVDVVLLEPAGVGPPEQRRPGPPTELEPDLSAEDRADRCQH